MSSCGDVGVVGGGARGFVCGGGGDGFLHGRVSVFVAKESPIPLRHRPWPLRLLPTLPAERCETSTFSPRQRHCSVLLPAHTTTSQHPCLRERRRVATIARRSKTAPDKCLSLSA